MNLLRGLSERDSVHGIIFNYDNSIITITLAAEPNVDRTKKSESSVIVSDSFTRVSLEILANVGSVAFDHTKHGGGRNFFEGLPD